MSSTFRERPEMKVYNTIENAEKALSASEIENRTGMNHTTIKRVLRALKGMSAVKEIETSGYTYYETKVNEDSVRTR